VETGARLTLVDVDVQACGGPAAVVLERSQLAVDGLRQSGNVGGALWADCASAARVWLGRHAGPAGEGLGEGCVRPWAERPAD
jgi:hypothetical protein